MSAAYELISFDLDGTLVDTVAGIAEAANRALNDLGMPRRPAQQIQQLVGGGLQQLMLRLWTLSISEHPERAGAVRQQDVLSSIDAHYGAIGHVCAVPYPGCREMLTALRAVGIRVACVTNKELRHARRILQHTDLDQYFDLVVGGDSLPVRKPDARVLRHVATTLDTHTSKAAHLGDSAIDVASARNSHITAWAVSYGYNAGVPIAEARPDRIFSTLSEVADFVIPARG